MSVNTKHGYIEQFYDNLSDLINRPYDGLIQTYSYIDIFNLRCILLNERN